MGSDMMEDALITTIQVYSRGIEHSGFRDDPFLPAPFPKEGAKWKDSSHNNSTTPNLLACIDNTEICDMESGQCSLVTRSSDQDPYLHSQDRTGVKTQAQLGYTLLSTALTASNIARAAFNPNVKLEAASHCEDPSSNYFNNHCFDLPPDQWRKEAPRWFEASLARTQFNLLETVRSTDKSKTNHEGIPDSYKGMCKMVKFRSVGWRNESVWGLLGLLALAAAITLASVKTVRGELWLHLGVVALFSRIRPAFESLKLCCRRVH